MHNITAPANDDASIERLIQSKGKVAERVTPSDLADVISGEVYFTAFDAFMKASTDDLVLNDADSLKCLTFCVLVLDNGFTVTGESACASPQNFDAEIGKRIAKENAVQKMWPLLGYELKSRLYRAFWDSIDPVTGGRRASV